MNDRYLITILLGFLYWWLENILSAYRIGEFRPLYNKTSDIFLCCFVELVPISGCGSYYTYCPMTSLLFSDSIFFFLANQRLFCYNLCISILISSCRILLIRLFQLVLFFLLMLPFWLSITVVLFSPATRPMRGLYPWFLSAPTPRAPVTCPARPFLSLPRLRSRSSFVF